MESMERHVEEREKKMLLMLAKGSFGAAYLLLYATCRMPHEQHTFTKIREKNQRHRKIGATRRMGIISIGIFVVPALFPSAICVHVRVL